MIVQRFVKWCETASSRQRAEGYAKLAQAFLAGLVPDTERNAALAALHRVVDDPSPLVRRATAIVLASDPTAPRPLLNAFLSDNDEIAAQVAESPALTVDDLLRALATAGQAVQIAIARRYRVPSPVASAIAWRGGAAACRALLANEGAEVSAVALRRLSDRFCADPGMRMLLAGRADLPADVRQVLVLETARSLQSADFVRRAMGEARAHRVVFQACERATASIGEYVEPAEVALFVDHLRVTGQISPAFLVRSACAGNIDLLAAALTALSGLSGRRVRAVLVDNRDGPFRALLRDCGLTPAVASLIRIAVGAWKEAATARRTSPDGNTPEAVIGRILAAVGRDTAARTSSGMAAMLRALEGEFEQAAVRTRADALLVA